MCVFQRSTLIINQDQSSKYQNKGDVRIQMRAYLNSENNMDFCLAVMGFSNQVKVSNDCDYRSCFILLEDQIG